MLDPVEFGKAMGAIVKDATAPLLRRIEELEARQLERGEKGDRGDDGASVTVADVSPMIADLVAKAVAEIPVPKDGVDGKDGKDADPIDVKEVVSELLAGDEIKTLVDLHVAAALPDTVAKHFEANPVRNGKDGDPGRDGDRGDPGTPGKDGDPGRDGLDVKDLFRADGGRLVAVMSDGTTKDLGEFVGKDGTNGTNGKDGRDGLGFDDCEIEIADGIVTHKFIRGDVSSSTSGSGVRPCRPRQASSRRTTDTCGWPSATHPRRRTIRRPIGSLRLARVLTAHEALPERTSSRANRFSFQGLTRKRISA
jgi:hypothetical protein